MKAKRIRSVSVRRAAQLREYAKLKAKWIKDNPTCMCYGCTAPTEDVHHMRGRIGGLLNDQRWWLPVCRAHHEWIHRHPDTARKLGYLGPWNQKD